MSVEDKSKIVNKDRITRIINRMCESGMQALIRQKVDVKLGIRCKFLKVGNSNGLSTIEFTGVSELGLKKLAKYEIVKFEVIGMPSQVVFVSKILEKTEGGLICLLPQSLVSIERRQNARCGTMDNKMAYVKLSLWSPSKEDVSAPPFFEQFRSQAAWLPILDISAGGICVKTHFPSSVNMIENVDQDENAQLILPMSDPLKLPLYIRWQRRIKNRVADELGERIQLEFRFGAEFYDVSEHVELRIKQFIRQLSLEDAI